MRHQARGVEIDRKKNKQDGMKKGSAEKVKKDEEMFEMWKRSMERRLGIFCCCWNCLFSRHSQLRYNSKN